MQEKQGAGQGHVDQHDSSTAPISPTSPTSNSISPISPTSPTPSTLFNRSSVAPSFQSNRFSQSKPPRDFAENSLCPLPEVVMDKQSSAPEPIDNLNHLDSEDQDDASTIRPATLVAQYGAVHDDASSTHPVVQPRVEPDFGDPRSVTQVYVDPSKSWIAKNKTWVIVGLAILVTILVGVTVGVVITERHKNAAVSRRVHTSSPSSQGSSS